MAKYVKVEFYEVEKDAEDQPDFELTLQEVANLPNDQSRVVNYKDTPIRIVTISNEQNSNEWVGDIVKIRMDNIPQRASTSGDLRPLNLQKNEGLGEETAFLYLKNKNLLVIQRNWYGISPNLLCKYFHSILQSKPKYNLKPIIKQEVFEELKKMKQIRKFRISFADIKNPEMLVDKNDGVGSALQKLNEYGGVNADIAISMGHSKKGMKKGNIVETVSTLLKDAFRSNVKTVEVSGRDENDESTVLNLLDAHISYGENIENDPNRNIPRIKRFDLLRKAWEIKRKEITNLIS